MTYYTREEIREKERARQMKRQRRKEYAPERTALPLSVASQTGDRPLPADGIDRFTDLVTGHKREICLTPEAMEGRRLELYARCGGHCEGCRISLTYEGVNGFHLHHVRGRGAGKRCDCMACIQALCKDMPMQDGTIRPGCHTKVHERGVLGEPYRRGAE
jgi:hypothetical protein